MFRIEIFVDDKKLAHVLHLLTGQILNEPKVQPVANAVQGKNGVKAATSGNTMDMLNEWLHKLPTGTVVTANIMRDFCSQHGLQDGSTYYLITKAVEKGWLKKALGAAGKTGLAGSKYRITGKGAAK